MASDLSQLIQESISNTLNGLLAKETKLLETTKTHEKDIQNLEVLQVNAIFDFEKISSTLSFTIPATSASFIFNSMMGDSAAQIVTTIDDDTKDAIEEFVSNLSGSLVTTINGSSFPDLGGAKFNIAKSQIIKGKELAPYENMFSFLLDLEGHQLIIFAQFDKILLPYIETLLKSDVTVHEEPIVEEVKEEPIIEEVKEEPKKEAAPSVPQKEEDKKNDEPQKEDTNVDPKDKKMKLIIMGIGGLIALLLIIGIIMYFMGVFDEPEPVVVKDVNVTKKLKKDQVKVITYTTLKKVNFKTSDINIKRLNGRLALLNKNSVLTPSQLSIEKIKEKKRLDALNIEKQYIEFAKHNKEEPLEEKPKIVKTEIKKVKQKEVITNNRTSQIVKQKVKTKTLKYIIVNSLQYKLFVNLLTQTNSDTAIASICSNDNGETVIFIGPFETDTSKNKMLDLIKQNDSNIDTKIENITKEQLNHYCNM